MRKKSGLIIGFTLVAILLCGCRRGKPTQSSSAGSSQSSLSTTVSGSVSITTSSTSLTSVTSHSSTSEPEPGDYYGSITDDLMGENLRYALNTLNKSHTVDEHGNSTLVGYDGLKTFAPKCDINPDDNTKMVGFYDNAQLKREWDGTATWNREHVWPNARGGNLVEADAFMARPCSVAINSSRGSKGYGTQSYDPYTDPKISNKVAFYRGVCARIIFYCMIANTNLILTDDIFNKDYGPGQPSNTMGTISDLLQWNLDYSPFDTSLEYQEDLARRVELNRNEVIYSDPEGQGNRNPFIDHPSYACRIWGSYNDKTRAVCGM